VFASRLYIQNRWLWVVSEVSQPTHTHQAADIPRRGQRHETALHCPVDPELSLSIPLPANGSRPQSLLRDLVMKGIECRARQLILDTSLLLNPHPCHTQRDHGIRLCGDIPVDMSWQGVLVQIGPNRSPHMEDRNRGSATQNNVTFQSCVASTVEGADIAISPT